MKDVKAIPTTYNGVTFRSRLEARWAWFFDHMKIEWLYEYEGYQLPGGWYLPDFFIPEMKLHIEVKPNIEEARKYIVKCGELSDASGCRTLLVWDRVRSQSGILMYRDDDRSPSWDMNGCRAIFGESSFVSLFSASADKHQFSYTRSPR